MNHCEDMCKWYRFDETFLDYECKMLDGERPDDWKCPFDIEAEVKKEMLEALEGILTLMDDPLHFSKQGWRRLWNPKKKLVAAIKAAKGN